MCVIRSIADITATHFHIEFSDVAAIILLNGYYTNGYYTKAPDELHWVVRLYSEIDSDMRL